MAGDGCSSTCTVEPGFVCSPANYRLSIKTNNYNYQPVGSGGASWTITGRTGKQTVNSNHATIGLIGAADPGVAYKFKVKVEDNDDDFIGFVIGYNDDDHTRDTADYILVDWKKANQSHGEFGQAKIGLAISRVTGIPSGNHFWSHTGNVTEPATVGRSATLGNVGWLRDQTYEFEITRTATSITVKIDGVTHFQVVPSDFGYAGDFPSGEIGYYSLSQPNVTYSFDGPLVSVCSTVCGDGVVTDDEGCDDGNDVGGDGCSATCTVESGYTCANAPGAASVCTEDPPDPPDAGDDSGATGPDATAPDSGVEPDATSSEDAGVEPGEDAGATRDAAPPADGDDDPDEPGDPSIDGGGCDCSVPGSSDPLAAVWLAIGGLGLVAARRRASRRR